MDSIALVANANYKLTMKRRELIKPDLNPPYTRLCKEDIKPSTKLFGDELPKHLKDMAEAKKAGRQMQRNSDTRTSSHNYLKAGRWKFRRSNFKPSDWTSTGQKTSHPRSFFRVRLGTKECPEKTQPIKQQRIIDNQVRTHLRSLWMGIICMKWSSLFQRDS